ncbi:MAG: carbamoyltransferase [Candidatus Saccharimonas sp.]|nr:carbamoyltransferase [Planctomycetaceae bacterium]
MRSILRPGFRAVFRSKRVYAPESTEARQSIDALREKLARGETAYVVGIGPAGHNSGVALIEVSATNGMRLISNDEEERFSGIKHDASFPESAIAMLRSRLDERGLTYRDLHAVVTSWDYISLPPLAIGIMFEHFPFSLGLVRPACFPMWDFYRNGTIVRTGPKRLATQLGAPSPIPLICQFHHDNHAAGAYALSPFAKRSKPVLVSVIDGSGDQGSISMYLATDGHLECIYKNQSPFDSLGLFYAIISSTKGGWTPLSSEGRYMGATAWGDGERLTNKFYRPLREIFHFAPKGEMLVNRAFVNWHIAGELAPYGRAMSAAFGEPIPHDKMWNPDAVLKVDDVQHSEITRDRCDLAAATQLVFEDALFHIIDHHIRATGCDQLVMTGGTALNCLANMRLVQHYDTAWYDRNLRKPGRLELWVPPIPGDAGVTVGAAINFAMQAGARPGELMRHAHYCGRGFTRAEIVTALGAQPDIKYHDLGNLHARGQLEAIADLAAFIIARDGVLGLFQGPAETGPRALGHRSILANPCNPETLEMINLRVKHRERVRPLAPMVTREAAEELFELSDGASADDYNAYNYMVLTALARPKARALIPAVVHKDGTARLQIVREDHDPFTHAFLRAMGRHVGVEASVNTSLNVGSPIAQTPAQAVTALERATGLTGLLMIANEGDVLLAWHNVNAGLKDGGIQLQAWLDQWHKCQIEV